MLDFVCMLLEYRWPQVSPAQPPCEAVPTMAEPPLPVARADGLLYECPLRCAAAIRTCISTYSGINCCNKACGLQPLAGIYNCDLHRAAV